MYDALRILFKPIPRKSDFLCCSLHSCSFTSYFFLSIYIRNSCVTLATSRARKKLENEIFRYAQALGVDISPMMIFRSIRSPDEITFQKISYR